jgi:hypothetical protein
MAKKKETSLVQIDFLYNEISALIEKSKQKAISQARSAVMEARTALEAMFYVLRSGIQWKAVPKTFGVASAVHRYVRFRRAYPQQQPPNPGSYPIVGLCRCLKKVYHQADHRYQQFPVHLPVILPDGDEYPGKGRVIDGRSPSVLAARSSSSCRPLRTRHLPLCSCPVYGQDSPGLAR